MSHASAPHDNAPLASSGGFDADLAFLKRWAGPLGLLARAMLAYVFFIEGVGKIVSYADVVGYMQSNGVDGRLLPLAIVTEIGGSLLVLAGFKTRWAAVALSGSASSPRRSSIAAAGWRRRCSFRRTSPSAAACWRWLCSAPDLGRSTPGADERASAPQGSEPPSGRPPRWRRNHAREHWPWLDGRPCSSMELSCR